MECVPDPARARTAGPPRRVEGARSKRDRCPARLLDSKDLKDAKPAASWEWVRLVALGVIVTGTVAGATAAGMPEGATTPLIGVVSLAAWGVLYGGRIVGAGMVDVMRGQSRG